MLPKAPLAFAEEAAARRDGDETVGMKMSSTDFGTGCYKPSTSGPPTSHLASFGPECVFPKALPGAAPPTAAQPSSPRPREGLGLPALGTVLCTTCSIPRAWGIAGRTAGLGGPGNRLVTVSVIEGTAERVPGRHEATTGNGHQDCNGLAIRCAAAGSMPTVTGCPGDQRDRSGRMGAVAIRRRSESQRTATS